MNQNEIMQLASNEDAMSALNQLTDLMHKQCSLEAELASVQKTKTELYLEIIECLKKDS